MVRRRQEDCFVALRAPRNDTLDLLKETAVIARTSKADEAIPIRRAMPVLG
jgi:hypothetical protein